MPTYFVSAAVEGIAMAYDIYGNTLQSGHCEVHPYVHEEYPCSVCVAEKKQHDQQQGHEKLDYFLSQAEQRIAELEKANAELNHKIGEYVDKTAELEAGLQKADEALKQVAADSAAMLRTVKADNERLRDLCRELQQWFEAYPVDIFTPLKGDPFKKTGDYDTKEKCNLITRASASMARHMIERIPEKISKALAAVEVDDD
jgi:hypothetical protein